MVEATSGKSAERMPVRIGPPPAEGMNCGAQNLRKGGRRGRKSERWINEGQYAPGPSACKKVNASKVLARRQRRGLCGQKKQNRNVMLSSESPGNHEIIWICYIDSFCNWRSGSSELLVCFFFSSSDSKMSISTQKSVFI